MTAACSRWPARPADRTSCQPARLRQEFDVFGTRLVTFSADAHLDYLDYLDDERCRNMRRRMVPLAAALATTLVASGCLGQQQEADSGRNADATDVELTITANAVKGGKNDLVASWLSDW